MRFGLLSSCRRKTGERRGNGVATRTNASICCARFHTMSRTGLAASYKALVSSRSPESSQPSQESTPNASLNPRKFKAYIHISCLYEMHITFNTIEFFLSVHLSIQDMIDRDNSCNIAQKTSVRAKYMSTFHGRCTSPSTSGTRISNPSQHHCVQTIPQPHQASYSA